MIINYVYKSEAQQIRQTNEQVQRDRANNIEDR